MAWETDAGSAAEKVVEAGGRLCYMSFGKGRKTNREYIHNILEAKHGSVIEHATWTFLLTGVSRSLTHELIRHRAGFSFSQLSQRYVDETDTDFVVPEAIAGNPEAMAVFERATAAAQEAYVQLVDLLDKQFAEIGNRTLRRKMARQAARSVLPNATETKIVVTANARSWRHFIEMRASSYSEPEIRRLAITILRVLQAEAPNLFGDYEITTAEDGSEVAVTEYSKV
ncbi:MAG: FAD-dependent thymidylate synthase [Chloroflexia bacterium]